MQQLQKIHGNSSNAEVANLAQQIADHYRKAGLDATPYLPGMIARISPLQHELSLAIKRIKTKSNLKQADADRDQALRALMHFVNGLQYHYAAEVKQAAQKVNKVLMNYGSTVARENYGAESSLVNSLLQDLNAENMQQAIGLLPGCAELITILQAKEQAFIDAQTTYTMAKVDGEKAPTACQLRTQLIQYLNSPFLVFLNAMYLVDEPLYGDFVRVVAVAIDSNNRTVRRRQGKRKAKKKAIQAVVAEA